MARFDKGVAWYTSGQAIVPVHFPEDQTICRYCQFCRSEAELNRYWCRLTNRIIYSINNSLPEFCPIQFEDNGGNEHE